MRYSRRRAINPVEQQNAAGWHQQRADSWNENQLFGRNLSQARYEVFRPDDFRRAGMMTNPMRNPTTNAPAKKIAKTVE